ncbi:hypothetical protein BD769DRAFT_1387802 [Suillus cothurnatus]|nr:hypothetical protein BD769DRAFT_1387802 [Suillus cothurnatus]
MLYALKYEVFTLHRDIGAAVSNFHKILPVTAEWKGRAQRQVASHSEVLVFDFAGYEDLSRENQQLTQCNILKFRLCQVYACGKGSRIMRPEYLRLTVLMLFVFGVLRLLTGCNGSELDMFGSAFSALLYEEFGLTHIPDGNSTCLAFGGGNLTVNTRVTPSEYSHVSAPQDFSMNYSMRQQRLTADVVCQPINLSQPQIRIVVPTRTCVPMVDASENGSSFDYQSNVYELPRRMSNYYHSSLELQNIRRSTHKGLEYWHGVVEFSATMRHFSKGSSHLLDTTFISNDLFSKAWKLSHRGLPSTRRTPFTLHLIMASATGSPSLRLAGFDQQGCSQMKVWRFSCMNASATKVYTIGRCF